MSRACGGCTACCKVYAILDIDKPGGQWCWHCQAGCGCLAYIHRPIGCRSFRCEWLKGWGGEGERPDRLGVVAEFFFTGSKDTVGIFQLTETEPGKFGKTSAFLRERSEEHLMLTFIHADGRKEARIDLRCLTERLKASFEGNGFLFVDRAPWEKEG